MLKMLIFAAIVAAQSAPLAAQTCAGPDPSILSAKVTSVTNEGGLDRYAIVGTVTNAGTQDQASNVLQSVDIYMDGQKLDAKSIPPLKAGQSDTFTYDAERAAKAGKGTTTLVFRFDGHHTTAADCSAKDKTYSLTF